MRKATEAMMTPPDESTVENVLEAVTAWKQGCPVVELLGAIRGRDLYTTVRALRPGHPQWRNLIGMIEDMATHMPISRHGMWSRDMTGQWWSSNELRDMQARIDPMPDGSERILFPIAYPWFLKPTDGSKGVRGEPRYPSS